MVSIWTGSNFDGENSFCSVFDSRMLLPILPCHYPWTHLATYIFLIIYFIYYNTHFFFGISKHTTDNTQLEATNRTVPATSHTKLTIVGTFPTSSPIWRLLGSQPHPKKTIVGKKTQAFRSDLVVPNGMKKKRIKKNI